MTKLTFDGITQICYDMSCGIQIKNNGGQMDVNH